MYEAGGVCSAVCHAPLVDEQRLAIFVHRQQERAVCADAQGLDLRVTEAKARAQRAALCALKCCALHTTARLPCRTCLRFSKGRVWLTDLTRSTCGYSTRCEG